MHDQRIQYIILLWYSRLHIISHILYYSLCQLTQLEKLNIGYNPLKTVPEVVSSLISLRELYMASCNLSTLPERFVSQSYCFRHLITHIFKITWLQYNSLGWLSRIQLLFLGGFDNVMNFRW